MNKNDEIKWWKSRGGRAEISHKNKSKYDRNRDKKKIEHDVNKDENK